MRYYLEFKDEKSNKFWQLELNGSEFTVTFGKIGTAGQSQTKSFSSAEEAKKEAEKQAAAKRKKGYMDAGAQPAGALTGDTQPTAAPKAEAPKTEPKPKEQPAAEKKPAPKPKAEKGLSAEAQQRIAALSGLFKLTIDAAAKGAKENIERIKKVQPLGCVGVVFKYSNNKDEAGNNVQVGKCTLVQLGSGSFWTQKDESGETIVLAKLERPGERLYPRGNIHDHWGEADEWEPYIKPEVLRYAREMMAKNLDCFAPKVRLMFEACYVFEADEYVLPSPARYDEWLKGLSPALEKNVEPVKTAMLAFAQKSYDRMREKVAAELRECEEKPSRYEAHTFRTWFSGVRVEWLHRKGGAGALRFAPQFSNTYYKTDRPDSDDKKKKDKSLYYSEEFERELMGLLPEQWKGIADAVAAFFKEKMDADPAFFFPAFEVYAAYDSVAPPELPDPALFEHEVGETLVDPPRYDEWHKEMLELIETRYKKFEDVDLMPVAGFEAVRVLRLMPEVGYEAVDRCLEQMIAYGREKWWLGRDEIVSAIDDYARDIMLDYGETMGMILGHDDGFVPAPEEHHDVLPLVALKVMLHTAYPAIDTHPPKMLRYLAKSGSQRAKDILDFGTGTVPKEYTQLKEKDVAITANDLKQVVSINIKKEEQEAYRKAVVFLTELLDKGFNVRFNVKLKSTQNNCVPATYNDDINRFWSNAAQYPALHEAIKGYVRVAQDKGYQCTYVDDMEADGEDVPLGGYAVYALAHYAKGEENDDIIAEYMMGNDTEHNCAMDALTEMIVNRTKLAPESFPLIAACMAGTKGMELRPELTEPYKENLAAFEAFLGQ